MQDQALQEQWQLASSSELVDLHETSIVANGIADGQTHTLTLSVASQCLHDTFSSNQISTVVVTRVDDKPVTSRSSFSIHLNQSSGSLTAVAPSSNADVERFSVIQELHDLQPAADDHSQNHPPPDVYSETTAIEQHQLPDQKTGWSKCGTISSTIDTVLTKAKGGLRVVFEKLPFSSSDATVSPHCARQQTFLGSFMGSPSCDIEKEPLLSSTTAADEPPKEDTIEEDTPSPGQPRSSWGPHYVLVPILVFASVFCCAGVTACVSRRCCSPRAKADWRARCEEVRNRRQYRRLQRHHAWRQWIKRMFGTRDDVRSADYDEKRRLILSQEHVLEDAMLAEIYRLRLEAGMTVEQIREADHHVAGSTDGSLPAYASRASDAPPSYRTSPSDTSSAPRSRAGSDSSAPPRIPRYTSPDSSIAALSPRHSSETLRSDGSLV